MAFPKNRQQKITILNKNLNGEWLCLKVDNKKSQFLIKIQQNRLEKQF